MVNKSNHKNSTKKYKKGEIHQKEHPKSKYSGKMKMYNFSSYPQMSENLMKLSPTNYAIMIILTPNKILISENKEKSIKKYKFDKKMMIQIKIVDMAN